MFKKDQISTTLSSATSTAVVEQVTSPFLYGQDIIVGMDYANDSVMTAKIEGSPDNSTYTDLFAPGAMDGVGGGALAQIVGDDPHHQAVDVGRVLADAANKGFVAAGGVDGHGVLGIGRIVGDDHAGERGEELPRIGGIHGPLELHVDGLGMADGHGDADARG